MSIVKENRVNFLYRYWLKYANSKEKRIITKLINLIEIEYQLLDSTFLLSQIELSNKMTLKQFIQYITEKGVLEDIELLISTPIIQKYILTMYNQNKSLIDDLYFKQNY